jgi:peptide/nickel transport system substrate-binding protein
MTHFGKRIMGVAAALAAAALVAACTASPGPTVAAGPSGAIGSVPPAAAGPQHAGTITWAMQPGAAPNWIFPIDTQASYSLANVQAFQWQMWRPLYWNQNGAVSEVVPSMSLAEPPVWSDGGKTVSITMKNTYKWSDGQPVTSKDLLFDLDLIKAAVKKAPSNWPAYVPGDFPDNLVSASTPNDATLILNLAAPVNPSWFQQDVLSYAGPVNPLPSHAWAKAAADGPILDFTDPANAAKIYDFLVDQAKSLSTYATNPLWQVVDGPYRLSAFNSVTGAFTMTPNTSYGGPHAAQMSNFEGVSFTSSTAELNALKTGSVDVGYVDLTAVPQIPSIERAGYHVFGMPAFGSNFMAFNYKDTTGHFDAIVSQLYFRQVMAHLVNQQGYIKAFMHGAGVESYGPIPTSPKSPYVPKNAAVNP